MARRTDKDTGVQLRNGFRFYRQSHRCRGWQARFRLKGVIYTRYFSDAVYGSAESARLAAERFASENRDLHKELLALRRRFEPRKNSRSGTPGVSRYEGDIERGPYWLAYWSNEEGRRISRRFSIARFGEPRALAMAIESREKAVRPFRRRYAKVLASLGIAPHTLKGGNGDRSSR